MVNFVKAVGYIGADNNRVALAAFSNSGVLEFGLLEFVSC
jgi:hypothetical protein